MKGWNFSRFNQFQPKPVNWGIKTNHKNMQFQPKPVRQQNVFNQIPTKTRGLGGWEFRGLGVFA